MITHNLLIFQITNLVLIMAETLKNSATKHSCEILNEGTGTTLGNLLNMKVFKIS